MEKSHALKTAVLFRKNRCESAIMKGPDETNFQVGTHYLLESIKHLTGSFRTVQFDESAAEETLDAILSVVIDLEGDSWFDDF